MKQLRWLFSQPRVFFNQLQWSRAHWIILVTFFIVASLETHTGKYSGFFLLTSGLLNDWFGFTVDQSVWVISVLKLSFMFLGIYALAQLIWWVGSLVGERGSKRVLFRRLAVVFAVFLLGSSLQNLSLIHPLLILVAGALYVWCICLGYYAVKEQFNLNIFETLVVAGLAVAVLSATLHVSRTAIQVVADAKEISLNPPAPAISNQVDEADEFLELDEE